MAERLFALLMIFTAMMSWWLSILDRTDYEEKISKGPSALPDEAFPVLVIVRAEREGLVNMA